ncbi:hypothetical protein NA57DRAFT_77455 [Rhizodiscina lignyota]|uniref:Tachykinin family protein n=1 Tax=Rhizodiscina lignyota TaxID=1504668 RepID=A0A9P4IET0_9PEZI|nr:hypothetical protein NA57DRAFT_77455 [Rhizodiscina lignyota]
MFQFINIHLASDAKPSDPQTRKRIRKQAMLASAKMARKRREKNPQFIFKLHTPVENAGEGSSSKQTMAIRPAASSSKTIEKSKYGDVLTLGVENPFPLLPWLYNDPGSGRRNPFVRYPIAMSLKTHAIIDTLFNDPSGGFCPFREFWYPASLTDPAAFHQTLSNICTNLAAQHPDDEETPKLSVIHHSLAIRSVSERLNDFQPNEAAGIITTVLSLAAHSNITANYPGFVSHMDAISRIAQLAGGIKAIPLAKQTRLLVFLVEVNGITRKDEYPRLPMPVDLIPSSDEFLPPGWSRKDPITLPDPLQSVIRAEDIELSQRLRDLYRLGAVLNFNFSARRMVWDETKISAACISPLLQGLLMLRPEAVDVEDPLSALREAVRIAALIALAPVRRGLGTFEVFSDALVGKLQDLLCQHLQPGNISEAVASRAPLIFWLLMTGAVQAVETEHALWFRQWIFECSGILDIRGWLSARSLLAEIFWIDEVHTPPGMVVWAEVRAI